MKINQIQRRIDEIDRRTLTDALQRRRHADIRSVEQIFSLQRKFVVRRQTVDRSIVTVEMFVKQVGIVGSLTEKIFCNEPIDRRSWPVLLAKLWTK